MLRNLLTLDNAGIALFLLTTIILGSLASFVTNLPAPTRKAEIASGVRAFK